MYVRAFYEEELEDYTERSLGGTFSKSSVILQYANTYLSGASTEKFVKVQFLVHNTYRVPIT